MFVLYTIEHDLYEVGMAYQLFNVLGVLERIIHKASFRRRPAVSCAESDANELKQRIDIIS